MLIAIALLFGIVAGLRTFTAPAAYFLHRGGMAGIVLAVCALGEYVMDAHPKAPSRLRPLGLGSRLISGAIVGWFVAGIPGAVAAAIGAMAGAYGGAAVRLKAIDAIGAIPAALAGDAVAIVLAIAAVFALGRV